MAVEAVDVMGSFSEQTYQERWWKPQSAPPASEGQEEGNK